MLYGNKGLGKFFLGEEMLFGHVISSVSNSRAPTTELRAICWALSVDLEHVNR
jgi:hypothetical protein